MTRTLSVLYNPALPPSLGGGPSANAEGGGTAFGMLISNIIGALFVVGFILAIIFFLLGALQWITSGGDKAQLEQARNKITNALIGLIIVAAGYAVFALVGQFLGLNTGIGPLKLTLPSFSG